MSQIFLFIFFAAEEFHSNIPSHGVRVESRGQEMVRILFSRRNFVTKVVVSIDMFTKNGLKRSFDTSYTNVLRISRYTGENWAPVNDKRK